MSAPPSVSVVIPAHNPHAGRLARTLGALRTQTLPVADWELVIVDNASSPPLAALDLDWHSHARIVHEPQPGLTRARVRGLRETTGALIVFVDDDNVLVPGFLEHACRIFEMRPQLGAAGGPVRPEFETPPPAWACEFHGLLALRDLGADELLAEGGAHSPWPACAPVGAGLCVRRSASLAYVDAVERDVRRRTLDRAGRSLASGGDSDFVFTILRAGWSVGYFPELVVTHLIPSARLHSDYLARLNRGIMRTWVRVLAQHGCCPWPAISRVTVPLRVTRSWIRLRAWRGPAERVRWHGARGQFEGQADLKKT